MKGNKKIKVDEGQQIEDTMVGFDIQAERNKLDMVNMEQDGCKLGSQLIKLRLIGLKLGKSKNIKQMN